MGWRAPGGPCPSSNIARLLASVVPKNSSLEDRIQYYILLKLLTPSHDCMRRCLCQFLPVRALWREKGKGTEQNLEIGYWENWKQTTHFPNFQGSWNFQNVASKGPSDFVLQYSSVVEKFLMSCLWLASKEKTYWCKATGVDKNEQMQGAVSMGPYRKKASSLIFRKPWHTWEDQQDLKKTPRHTKLRYSSGRRRSVRRVNSTCLVWWLSQWKATQGGPCHMCQIADENLQCPGEGEKCTCKKKKVYSKTLTVKSWWNGPTF